MVGTLKPSITFGLLPSLQLAPSSLPVHSQFAPRCEPPGETFTTRYFYWELGSGPWSMGQHPCLEMGEYQVQSGPPISSGGIKMEQ